VHLLVKKTLKDVIILAKMKTGKEKNILNKLLYGSAVFYL
jgi:hypothetical protein